MLINLISRNNLEYLFFLFLPVIWGLRPKHLLPLIGAIPCVALNLLADHPSQKNLVLHYSLPAIPFLLLSVMETLAKGKTWIQQKRAMILWSLASFLILGKYGFFTGRYLKFMDNLPATQQAIALVKTEDSLLTTGLISPHLTHRELISFNYPSLEQLPKFHYILLNTHHPNLAVSPESLQSLVNRLEKNPEFHLTYQRDDVYLFVKQ